MNMGEGVGVLKLISPPNLFKHTNQKINILMSRTKITLRKARNYIKIHKLSEGNYVINKIHLSNLK